MNYGVGGAIDLWSRFLLILVYKMPIYSERPENSSVVINMHHSNKLYQKFFKAFSNCHPTSTQANNQVKANKLWKTIKKKNEAGAIEIDMEIYNAVVSNLESLAVDLWSC